MSNSNIAGRQRQAMVTRAGEAACAAHAASILEDHFDEMGLSDEERNQRVAHAAARIDAAVTRANALHGAEAQPTEAMLDLAVPRVIVLDDRGGQYVLCCRRITDADWLAYFAGIVVTSEQQGKERINVVDVNSSRLALAEAVLESAAGYRVAGGVDLRSLPDWKKKLPLAHRLQLGEVLADARVSPGDSDDLVIYPEGEMVSLDATWSAVKTERDGIVEAIAMQRFSGLKHLLQSPSEEQHRRYASQASRARVVGGSRSGKTIYPGAHALLAKLYDELVISVDGYSFAGKKLGMAENGGRDQIIREMDMLHKVMAAQELFQPQSTAQLAGAKGE